VTILSITAICRGCPPTIQRPIRMSYLMAMGISSNPEIRYLTSIISSSFCTVSQPNYAPYTYGILVSSSLFVNQQLLRQDSSHTAVPLPAKPVRHLQLSALGLLLRNKAVGTSNFVSVPSLPLSLNLAFCPALCTHSFLIALSDRMTLP